MATTRLQVGDLTRVQINDAHRGRLAEVDFRISGTVRHFPTMYGELDFGYLITSRDLLLALLNDTAPLPSNPNEAFVLTGSGPSPASLSALVPMLAETWQAESIRRGLKANPLALGLRSVTFFGSVLMIVLSLVGFATYLYLGVRQRDMLYGVMRALGMSARQIYASIVIEQAVLILAGLGLGTVLGVLLNQITLSRLPVSLGDRPPVPPFVPREDWLAVAGLYLGLVLAFMAILAIVTALLWRARIHSILRIGQE
jgi:putative ABC transport system permease protein